MQRLITIQKLDLYKENTKEYSCVQEDDILFQAYVFENGKELDLTGKEVYVEALDANNEIDLINKAKAKVVGNHLSCFIPRHFTRYLGIAMLQVTIKSDVKQVSSYPVTINVTELITEGKEVEGAYQKILDRLNERLEYLEELIKNQGNSNNKPQITDLDGGFFTDTSQHDVFDCGAFTDTDILISINGGGLNG